MSVKDFWIDGESLYAALELHLSRLKATYITVFLALVLLGFALWYVFFLPTPDFPAGQVITIPSGEPVSVIANELKEEGIIRSPRLFEILTRLRGTEGSVKSGKYVFAEPTGLFRVQERIQDGAFGIVATRVTFIEGSTVREMGRELKATFPSFDEDAFLAQAIPLEGYLFPDTYYFYPDVTPDEVVAKMYADWQAKIATIEPQIDAFGHPVRDDLIMASILEDEARTLADKQMVAGILWNRVNDGMPLQVDAVFGYINDRAEYSPTLADLAASSTYNTYLYPGLPPGPIGNPGLESILAAVTPATTTDLYYLTGTDGEMHYEATFAEHTSDRAKYLN